MNGWKQPVENLESYFGEDYIALLLWERLLIRAKNSEEPRARKFAGKLHFLQKGQTVCGEGELAKIIARSRGGVRAALERLQNLYNKIDISPTPRGTVVTIKNYSDVVQMGQPDEHPANIQ